VLIEGLDEIKRLYKVTKFRNIVSRSDVLRKRIKNGRSSETRENQKLSLSWEQRAGKCLERGVYGMADIGQLMSSGTNWWQMSEQGTPASQV
jgi:ribose 1,5-bisphosphokinase PhnN